MKIKPFKLERFFGRYEFSVEYMLGSSDCESLSIGELLALEPDARERFEQHWLGYTESEGAPSLRKEIARIYQTMQPQNILVHNGAEEAIFLFMHALLNAGDHIIVHTPCYQSHVAVAESIGCEVSRWNAREENGWALDVEEMRGMIRPNTRAVLINTPHNPTGYSMPRGDSSSLGTSFLRVNEIAREHNLILFSDEVFRELEYDAVLRLPAACDVNDTAVSLGVMSKTYGLPGLRIGWIATRNRELYERMLTLKDYTTICNGAPGEFLAELALRHREKLAKRNLELIKRNLNLLDNFFEHHADQFSWIRPNGGPIAFPKLLRGDIETFCDELAKRAGVLLLPGTLFDDTGNHFRIGFSRKNMPEALARVEAFLDK